MLAFSNTASAQDYLDIADFNYTFASPASDTGAATAYGSANILVPILLKNNDAITIGANANVFEVNTPESNGYRFYNLTLPVGIHKNLSDNLSVDVTTLNRINSDFSPYKSSHYQFGVLTVFKKKRDENFSYKFGFYYNGEKSGPLFTPLLGVDWKVNDKLQVFGVLPRDATLFYRASDRLAYGASFRGQIASYDISTPEEDAYIQRTKNELGLFADFYLTDRIVLQGKGGYLVGTQFKEYNHDQQVDWALGPVRFGDDRNLNRAVSGDGAFVKISLIYRYDLSGM